MLIQADARAIPLRDGCVQCVVTSPPYWGLRDYGHGDQIGMERTPDAYVASLRAVFQGLARVLRADGTVWLNLGDSYSAHAGQRKTTDRAGIKQQSNVASVGAPSRCVAALGAKNLVGIPWRVAFALQADGWYLRSDVIWSKPNPMPESVTDRPTKAHEYLFLLTKSERYYYDAAAIAEPVSAAMLMEMEQGYDGLGLKDYEAAGVQNPSSVKARIIANARARVTGRGVGKESDKQPDGRQAQRSNSGGYPTKQAGHGRRYDGFNERYFSADAKHCRAEKNAAGRRLVENVKMARDDGAEHEAGVGNGLTRNKRTVWTVNTQPYAGAHFATMPEKLVEPCILAGSRLGDFVFDPFSGSGTVLAVAERLGRRGVGTDLNPAYHALAKQRTAQRGLRW